MIKSQIHHDLQRYPKLKKKIAQTTTILLENRLKTTMSMIVNTVNSELAYINTRNPDFEIYNRLTQNSECSLKSILEISNNQVLNKEQL